MGDVEVVTEIEIHRPATEVFDFVADVANNPQWQRGMHEAYFTSGPPLRVGSTYAQVTTFLGQRIESRFVVVEYEPGRLVKGSTTVSPFPITFTRIVEPAGSASRVTAVVKGRPDGAFTLASPLVRRLLAASVARDYQNLKRLLEG
jgi:hypothetical protein